MNRILARLQMGQSFNLKNILQQQKICYNTIKIIGRNDYNGK